MDMHTPHLSPPLSPPPRASPGRRIIRHYSQIEPVATTSTPAINPRPRSVAHTGHRRPPLTSRPSSPIKSPLGRSLRRRIRRVAPPRHTSSFRYLRATTAAGQDPAWTCRCQWARSRAVQVLAAPPLPEFYPAAVDVVITRPLHSTPHLPRS